MGLLGTWGGFLEEVALNLVLKEAEMGWIDPGAQVKSVSVPQFMVMLAHFILGIDMVALRLLVTQSLYPLRSKSCRKSSLFLASSNSSYQAQQFDKKPRTEFSLALICCESVPESIPVATG